MTITAQQRAPQGAPAGTGGQFTGRANTAAAVTLHPAEKPRIAYLEDAEGDGVCGHCNREGLRWVVHFHDGAAVGLQCARKHLGVKVAAKDIAWQTGFTPIAEHREHDVVYMLWSNGRRTNMTQNGLLVAVGGQQAEWEKNGWLPA
ncbi:hypothetical protein ACFVAJ_16920 [Agromyces sp. NPDC057679]|uniref:hypothetical protein n=1 Tax=Agromyces sp. NPDC057679 TaxID=3346207 RepID=UPI00366B3D2E